MDNQIFIIISSNFQGIVDWKLKFIRVTPSICKGMKLIKAKQYNWAKKKQRKRFLLVSLSDSGARKREEGKRVKKMDNSSDTTFFSTDHPSSVALLPAQAGEGVVTFLFWLHPST